MILCMHCNNPTKNKNQMKETIKEMNKDSSEINEWLKALNDAMKAGGDPDHNPNNLISLGEASSLFTEMKRKIEGKGYQIKWKDTKYVLVSPNQ